MPEITINIGKIEDRIVSLYKARKGFKNKEVTINDIIETFGEEMFSEEEINRDWKEDPATDSQIYFLKKKGIDIKKNMTKFECSKIIEELKKEENIQVGNTERLVPEKERSNVLQKSPVLNDKPVYAGNPEKVKKPIYKVDKKEIREAYKVNKQELPDY